MSKLEDVSIIDVNIKLPNPPYPLLDVFFLPITALQFFPLCSSIVMLPFLKPSVVGLHGGGHYRTNII